jgi:hypothetical protein
MNAIRVHQQITSRVLEIPELDRFIGKDVEIIVIEESHAPPAPVGPKAGGGKGEATMSPDFDAPLEDFAEYM